MLPTDTVVEMGISLPCNRCHVSAVLSMKERADMGILREMTSDMHRTDKHGGSEEAQAERRACRAEELEGSQRTSKTRAEAGMEIWRRV